MTELDRPQEATYGRAPLHPARVWVLDDPRVGTANQALGIAERLGVPFRRIPMSWNPWTAHLAGLVPGGSLAGLRQPTRGIAAELARQTAGVSLPAARGRASWALAGTAAGMGAGTRGRIDGHRAVP